MLVSNLRNGFDIHQAKGGVRWRFDPDELGIVRPDQLLHVELDAWREGDMDAVCRRNLGEISVRSTVHIGHRDDMRARCQRLEDGGCGCGAGRERKSVLCVLESCDCLLEVIPAGMSVPYLTIPKPSTTDRFGLALRAYSYSPTGLPTLVWAKVVDSEI